jgi:class 3 adenylate cyclase/tetratricopeptide (TPR) repeat protein
VERKLLTILFVDLVNSTALVTGADPEVARRRVGDFLDHVRSSIHAHGGTVGRYAGDALMATFGIPQAHEDDAVRAVRAGLSLVDEVGRLGLEARVGIESGEVLTDEEDATFATGEPINIAVRLQEAAGPGEILLGPGAHRLTVGRVDAEERGPVELRGIERPVWAWRAVSALDGQPRRAAPAAPFVGREDELELLEHTFARVTRAERAHLFTIYGEPGVGKSRLVREFLDGLEGATVLVGRSLPYGESITYWPVAEMVKAAAGITDDEPVKEAVDKLKASCENEAVADLLGLASGVLEAVESERSRQEIAWAVRAWAEQLAQAQPLVLVFEDIHWAEEPLLELIEHLAAWVREAPLLLLCLARTELLDVRPDWAGGKLRSTAIELEPLAPEESDELVAALLSDTDLGDEVRSVLREKTGGNPLFVEETIRMLVEEGGDGDAAGRIPDTVQAIIAARIDRLPPGEKEVLQRAGVIGRVFWPDAVAYLSPGVESVEACLDDLLLRDFLLRDARSTISGERAYRFKHVLIQEVAYGGLSKLGRAELHTRFAEWLAERAGEELLEVRAFHLDRAAALRAELDGAAPEELAHAASAALETAGRRALARDANRVARKLLLRAAELEPTLERRYLAARAAWRLTDYPAVRREMEDLRHAAREAGERNLEGRALAVLAEVAVMRDADVERARELVEQALPLLEDDDLGRYQALAARCSIAWSLGDLAAHERFAAEAVEIARAAGRNDLESEAVNDVASAKLARLELSDADEYVERGLRLAAESGSIVARGLALRFSGLLRYEQGRLDEAEEALQESRRLLTEAGAAWSVGRTLTYLGWTARAKGKPAEAERHFRESIRTLKPIEDRAALCESQRALAQLLAELGRLDEAERFAHDARETVGPRDLTSLATTTMALGLVRAAQGRDDEAEELLREAVATLDGTDFARNQVEALGALAAFLRERGRADEASGLDAHVAELRPASFA